MGELSVPLLGQIETLSLEQLENLGEPLLDIQVIPQGGTAKPNADLESWLSRLE